MPQQKQLKPLLPIKTITTGTTTKAAAMPMRSSIFDNPSVHGGAPPKTSSSTTNSMQAFASAPVVHFAADDDDGAPGTVAEDDDLPSELSDLSDADLPNIIPESPNYSGGGKSFNDGFDESDYADDIPEDIIEPAVIEEEYDRGTKWLQADQSMQHVTATIMSKPFKPTPTPRREVSTPRHAGGGDDDVFLADEDSDEDDHSPPRRMGPGSAIKDDSKPSKSTGGLPNHNHGFVTDDDDLEQYQL